MQEFATVSASSFDPAALATKLTEKSAEGWTIVSIVPTGGDITAFLSREAGAAAAAPAAAAPAAEPAPVATPEPAGWAVAPEPAAPAAMAPIADPTPAGNSFQPTPAPGYQPAPAPAPAYQPAPAAAAVPAGWYADPAGRYELRYWDGGTWTEHVSRAGQQFTDPPVA
ncbi:MAG TPA: DUF2510 domain-containing protein [Ilumatobacteraceae bacterium]|nr:DUF2510 domain-containing protein [Ilumatobacteraceae bacterium]